jgi:hypothetical protein
MEERKDGMTEQANGSGAEGFLIEKQISPELFTAFYAQVGSKHYNEEGHPDVFRVFTSHPTIQDAAASTSLRTTFAPGPGVGQLRCLLAGEVKILSLGGTPEEWQAIADKLTARNAALGLVVPEAKEGAAVILGHGEVFPVAAGFVPMHKLSERNRAGLPLFPEASRTFHALRTPLNWAVGAALFRFTSPDRPGDWQEVTINALTDQVYCLTERDAPRRGDHAPDVLGEVVKLFAETIAIVTPRTEKCGRIYKKRTELILDRIIATLGLTYLDMKTGRLVRPDDPSFQKFTKPLEVKGRRVYTPDGKDIKALTGDRWKLETIRWRWSPTIVDDLLAAPVLDKKGNVIRDKAGKVIRGGWNVKVFNRIFDALFRLRSEKAYVAHDLLILLATDIYKPTGQSTAGRNMVEKEAGRLFDLLGLEYDPKHKGRREEAVAAAIFRLKQPDIGALLPGSDELPYQPSQADLLGGRWKNPRYRLRRSALYTPPGILTKAEVAAIEAEYEATPGPLALPEPKKTKADQIAFPGIIEDAPPIPSGSSIRAAREAAGINLRDFARMMDGPGIAIWSRYETGTPIRVDKITPEVWERVREFIAQHGKKT